tara:strand:- start:34 stop:492 length:459 start_codon:yes stop_codon:yes gene_type:complete
MRFNVIFKQKNPEFDKEYAKEYHFGKESENNLKDLWSTTYSLNNDVKEYSITENGEYNLKGTLTNGEVIDELIPNMQILKCFDNEKNEVGNFAVSSNIIDKTHKAFNKKHNITRYYYYLKTNEEFIEVKNGVFVNISDIPEKLIQKTVPNNV